MVRVLSGEKWVNWTVFEPKVIQPEMCGWTVRHAFGAAGLVNFVVAFICQVTFMSWLFATSNTGAFMIKLTWLITTIWH